MHLRCICYLYIIHHEPGRDFVHEHPAGALSWKEECVQRVLRRTGARLLTIGQCQYGLAEVGKEGARRLVKKQTTLMTQCPAMATTLNIRCKGDHTHTWLEGKEKAQRAQQYPDGLVDAMVKGVKLQKRWDQHGIFFLGKVEMGEGTSGKQDFTHTNEVPPEEESIEEWFGENPEEARAVDDVTGEDLNPEFGEEGAARRDRILL